MDNRIKEWRLNRGLSARELALKLDTGRSTIVKLERGDRRLTTAWIERIAQVLNLTPVQLLSSDAQQPTGKRLVSVPIIKWENAREYAVAAPVRIPGLGWEKAEFVAHGSESLIGMEVLGDEMDRLAPVGAMICVDYLQKTLIDGGCYVFNLGDQVLFRRYRDTGGPARFEPASTNVKHETIYPETIQSLPIVGRVIKVTIDLDSLMTRP